MPAYPCCCPVGLWCDLDIKKYNVNPTGARFYPASLRTAPVHSPVNAQSAPNYPEQLTGDGYYDCDVPRPIAKGMYADMKLDMYRTQRQIGTAPNQCIEWGWISYEMWDECGPVDIMLSNWDSLVPRGGCSNDKPSEGSKPPYSTWNTDCYYFQSQRSWWQNAKQFVGEMTLRYNGDSYPYLLIEWEMQCISPGVDWQSMAGPVMANVSPYGTPGEESVRLGLPNADDNLGGWLFYCKVWGTNGTGTSVPRIHREYYDWWINGDPATSRGDFVFGMPEGPVVPKLVYDYFNDPTKAPGNSWYDSTLEWSQGATPFVAPEFTWDHKWHVDPQVAVVGGQVQADTDTNDVDTRFQPTLLGRVSGNVAVAYEVPA